jgi:hypothetical protein
VQPECFDQPKSRPAYSLVVVRPARRSGSVLSHCLLTFYLFLIFAAFGTAPFVGLMVRAACAVLNLFRTLAVLAPQTAIAPAAACAPAAVLEPAEKCRAHFHQIWTPPASGARFRRRQFMRMSHRDKPGG